MSANLMTPSLNPAEYNMQDSIGYLLARAKSALTHEVEQEVSALDITHVQAVCLMMLGTGRASTVTDLGREMGTDMGSVTRLLGRMEKRGLIERQRSTSDRRVVELSLTEQGRAMMVHLPAIFIRVVERRLRGFSPDEITCLRTMLTRVIDNNSG
ncbi:MarR family transcriptional regulator [Cupriavidus sp. USMAA2-4]|uniref:MarR family transcriptional regulator n=1 Tax=Cupriavidus malaysiensis TaxID=367825 RepID=A0ABN4TI19_9BURK|nr:MULTISPECIES: MarR family transcriptional regulator [Cupriavidus]AOY93582.1 MarR family transcriptional regulator [Cupriavidus sp. USMAA2-4]AOZ00139.1 MarR family transcriptional regulator [Cupriavidus sp. USMAHM13]AOZ06883.1 MarR family transcriptional regulator [Cupriavidus malaysiensis]